YYTDLADAILQAVIPIVYDHFIQSHGHVTGASFMVLGMGSLGARSLSSDSDLDLMMIFDADPAATSDGPRALLARPYFARLTQTIITALTAPMRDGRLYEVDMRLRPSGKAGPVATRIESFDTYQRQEAWTWEHLALTRARPVAGDPTLMDRVEQLRRDILAQKADGATVTADVADMRQRLAQDKPQNGPWDMKNGPGGLMDMELFAQYQALTQRRPDRRVAQQLGTSYGPLADIYTQLTAFKVIHGVLCKDDGRTTDMGPGAWDVMSDMCQIANMPQLETHMSLLRAKATAVIDKALAEQGG
ncbi:MAG: glutamine-synthetase adenylyltransferase, partial [Pseudomonadota bacterium]